MKTTVLFIDQETKIEIAKELGDVLWYVAIIALEIGISLFDVATMNLKKLFGLSKDQKKVWDRPSDRVL